MTTIGSHDARTHFAELLRRVEQGEEFTITRNGVPVAKLMPVAVATPVKTPGPVETPKELTPHEAIEGIIELRKGHTLGGLSIRELIDEGRR